MATNKGLGPGKATRCAPSVTSPLILYIKAAKDGKSTGDCPFAHAVRMGLSSKGAPCVIHPTTASTKPSWLLEHYEGKMPALKHESDCYVESRRILQYIDFFFEPHDSLFPPNLGEDIEMATDGFFGALARFIKNTEDEKDDQLLTSLKSELSKMEAVCSGSGWFATDDISYLDCELAPKLHIMATAVPHFKSAPIDLEGFPKLQEYIKFVFASDAFKTTCDYTAETVLWGWEGARKQ